MNLVIDFILVTGILLNTIALIGLFRLKNKKKPHYILIAFWFCILDILLFFYSILHDLSILEFITYYIQDGVRFLIPPLIYIYVKSLFIESKTLLKDHLVHFIPFVLYLILYSLPSSLHMDFYHIEVIQSHIELALEKDLYGIVYFILSLRLFYQFKKSMKENYSNMDEKSFLWIEKFLISFLAVLLVDFLLTVSELSFGYDIFWDSYITVIFLIVAISYLGYYGLTQSTIFLPDFLIETHLTQNNEVSDSNSYIKNDEKELLKRKFYEQMEDKKLYLSPDLSLKLLAEEMEISERKLSAFFSEILNSNFYDSINSFRVNEAKTILKSDIIENHSITGIGLSCGFKSKSSFYRIFKKHTKMSPSTYRTAV